MWSARTLANNSFGKVVELHRKKESGNALCKRIDEEKNLMLHAQLLQELHELNERQKAEERKWMAEQGWEIL